MSEKIARDIARKFGIHVEWAPANREYVVDTRPFGTAKEARKYARSLSRMRTLADYRIVNDMSNDTQTRNILAVIRKAERDGVVIDDGNVVDLIADNITSFTTLNDIRAALVHAGLASRFPRATRQQNPKRRKKSARKKSARKKVRAKTRVAVRYKITAQNKGKRMHFDGRNFSERPTVKSFALASDAKHTAFALIRRYPILRKYRVRVESFP